MKFLELKVENFMSWGSATVPLSDQGLVLVQGSNGDSGICGSNGSGKSSLFVDSWLWTLYGKTARGLSGDSVVRKGSEGGCFCSLGFVDSSGTKFFVRRYQGHSQFGNNLQLCKEGENRVSVDISKTDKRETQAEIERLLGFPMKVALNAMVLGQNSIAFATMTDAEKKSTLEKVLGFDILSRAQKRAKEKLVHIEGDLSSKNVLISSYSAQKESLQAELDQSRKDSAKWEAEQEVIGQGLIKEQDENDRRQITFRSFQNTTQDELDVAIQQQLSVVKENAQVVKTLRGIEEEARARGASAPSEEERIHLEGERQHSSELLMRADMMRNKLVDNAKLKYDKAVAREIPEVCPTCSQRLPEASIQAVRTSFSGDIEASRLEFEGAQFSGSGTVNLAFDRLVKASAEVYLFQKEKEKVKPEFDKLNKRLQWHVDKSARLTFAIGEVTKTIDNFNLSLSECNTSITGCDIERAKIEAQLNSRPENPYSKSIESNVTRGADVAQKLASAQDGIDQLKGKVKLYRFWSKGFGKDGIQSYMLDSLIPFLNKRVGKYAEILLEGEVSVHFKTQRLLADQETLKEDFHVSITNRYGADVYKGNSAGEQERVDICIALGLQDLVISRQGEGFSLCILDEVARHIDQEGVELYYQLLSQLSRERSSAFVITHSPHLESLFSRIWTAKKEGGVSKLEVV